MKLKNRLVFVMGFGFGVPVGAAEPSGVAEGPASVGTGIYYDASLYYIDMASGTVWDPEDLAVSANRCRAASVAFLLFLDLRDTDIAEKKKRYAGLALVAERLMKHLDRDRVEHCLKSNLLNGDGTYAYLEGVSEEQFGNYVKEFMEAFPPRGAIKGGADPHQGKE